MTPRDLWLGGRSDGGDSSESGSDHTAADDGAPQTSRQGLECAMRRFHFELVQEQEMPVVLRLNARKCEVSLSNVTVWRRTA